MKKDNDEQLPAFSPQKPEDNNKQSLPFSLSRPFVEHKSMRVSGIRNGSSKVPSAETNDVDNLPGEQQDQACALGKFAQEIDNIHTYVQGKSAGILEKAISKLVSDLKNKRFENKKMSGK